MIYADLMGTMSVNVGFPRDHSLDRATAGRYSADDLWKQSLRARMCNLYEDNRAFPILARSKLLVN